MPLFPPQIAPQYLGVDVAALNGGQNQTLGAGTVYLYEVEIPVAVTITGFKYRAGNAATGYVNGAIYTAAGNIVAGSDTGAITNQSVTTNVSFSYVTPFTLSPGVYFLAFGVDLNTDTFIALVSQTGGQIMSRVRVATNTVVTPGATQTMPTTTGALLTNNTKCPAFSFPLSGGI